MTAFVLATRSRHKQREIQQLLDRSTQILTLDDAGVPYSPDEERIEVFDTFRENAIAKARYFLDKTGMRAIADDSGIIIDALHGEPGVRSKRFSGRTDLDGEALDLANNAHAVARLRLTDAVRDEMRPYSAHYMCVAALAHPDGDVRIALGSVSGTFLLEPRGNGGFGYDPHFLLPAIGHTFGELSDDEKHRYSHRARAFRALAPLLF